MLLIFLRRYFIHSHRRFYFTPLRHAMMPLFFFSAAAIFTPTIDALCRHAMPLILMLLFFFFRRRLMLMLFADAADIPRFRLPPLCRRRRRLDRSSYAIYDAAPPRCRARYAAAIFFFFSRVATMRY